MQLLVQGADALFIHIPKTGGNTLQREFMRLGWSQDRYITSEHRDGLDRFELIGQNTRTKHQQLADYVDLWPPAQHCKVYASLRQPVKRLVSLYFSPHRWLKQDAETGQYKLTKNVSIDTQDFESLVKASSSAVDALFARQPASTDSPISDKYREVLKMIECGRMRLMRTDKLAQDFALIFARSLCEPRRNISPFQDQAKKAAESEEIQHIILNSHHAIDQQLWEDLNS